MHATKVGVVRALAIACFSVCVASAWSCSNHRADEVEHVDTHHEAAVLAPGFSAEIVIDGLDMPTAMRFTPDGRLFVAEKRGTIKLLNGLSATPVTIADIRTEVMDFWDRGLLDIAVDPSFPVKPYVYALYNLDGRLGDSLAAGTVPRYRDGCADSTLSCPVVAHLDRIEVDPTTGMMIEKTTLIENWGNQYPSHGMGNLQWGPDGYLYISAGDGASFAAVDYGDNNVLGDPPNAGGPLTPPSAQGGAVRSQIVTPPAATPAFPTWFNGKVVRVDPHTMTPMLDPRTVPSPPPIVARGLRNPFRMTFRGATNELWIADVGWGNYEEINRIVDVAAATVTPLNFGWPCYEGNAVQGAYQGAGLTVCQNLYAAPGSVVAPFYQYGNGTHVVTGDNCFEGGSSLTGIAFYDGATFPAEYEGALFFSDYARQCTWYLPPGANGLPDPTSPRLFAQGAGAPVQLSVGPDGDLYYVDIQGGAIGRYHYTSQNHAPDVALTASRQFGPVPLSVSFDASGSTDADGDALSFAWDLDGDGAFDDATGATAAWVYGMLQSVAVRVRVTDAQGASTVATTLIVAGNPPVPSIAVLTAPNWTAGEIVTLAASATDAEDGALPATAFEWSIALNHCSGAMGCHPHVLEELSDLAQVSFTGPEHDYPSHLEIVLTATDSDGLSSSTTLLLDPATTHVSIVTVPSGMRVALNQSVAVAPLSATVIRGSTSTVSAPEQVVGGSRYKFQSWSDGGAAAHSFRPDQQSLELTATFVLDGTERNLSVDGTPIALITAPTGSGSRDLNIIKDGVKPGPGPNDGLLQYDTYNGGGARPNDWVGYTFAATKEFTKVVFQEGKSFPDGGAFDSLVVQTRLQGVWTDVQNLVSAPPYTRLNGVGFESFELSFTPQLGDGLRIFGTPSGGSHFISVAELEVYGIDRATGNAPPLAAAGADQTVSVGAQVTLAGSGTDPEGASLTYAWSQTSGAPVTLSSTTSATPTFTAPALGTTLTFSLVTNDGVQSSAADSVTIHVTDPNPPANVNLTASGTPVAFITAPTGGGNRNLAIIKDGVRPAVGSASSSQQYDTWNGGGARPNEWVGYTFTSPKLFNELVFQEGMNFWDGGAFSSVTVQVRSGGVWSDVSGVTTTPAYPGLNGVSFETFTFTFAGVSGDGIRLSGTPAGAARFISIAELEVYGDDEAGPPPNLPPTCSAGPDQNVSTSALVTLSGAGTDPEGAPLAFSWSQIGGLEVTLSSMTVASPTFTAPSSPTTLTFALFTSDGEHDSIVDTVDVVVTDASSVNLTAAGTPTAFITAPTGGGNKNLGIIKDGIKPTAGSNDASTQYDTWNGGGARATDWFGYTFATSRIFSRVVFQEGMHFADGGAFVAGSLVVQVRSDGVWTTVGGLVAAPSYPGPNAVSFETFTLTFDPAAGDGIRVSGTPSGSARFSSIAELEVYGN